MSVTPASHLSLLSSYLFVNDNSTSVLAFVSCFVFFSLFNSPFLWPLFYLGTVLVLLTLSLSPFLHLHTPSCLVLSFSVETGARSKKPEATWRQ